MELKNEYVILQDRMGRTIGATNDWQRVPDAYDYIIFKEGTTIKAKHSRSGRVVYTASDIASIISEILNNTLDPVSIFVSAGEYPLMSTLRITKSVSFIGAGIGKTVFRKKASVDMVEIGGDGTDYVENVVFRGVELDGNYLAGFTGAGLKVGYSKNVIVEDVYIHDNYFLQLSVLNTSPGLAEDYLPTNVIIQNIYVRGYTSREATEAVLLGGRYVSAKNVYIWDANKGAALHVYDNTFDRSHDISLSHVFIYNSYRGLQISAPYNVTGDMIHIENINAEGIRILPNEEASDQAGGLVPVHDIELQNVTLRNTCIDVPSAGAAIVIRNAQHVKVSARVNTCQLPAVRIDTPSQWGYDPSFETQDILLNLDVRNCGLQGGVPATQTGVTLWLNKRNIRNVIINGIITNNKSYSIGVGRDDTSLIVEGIDINAYLDQGIKNEGYLRKWKNSGVSTFSADGSTTQFNIPHLLISTPSKILVTAMSSDAAGDFYVTADSTYIYVNYKTAPPSGTNNVILSWCAEV